MASYLRRNLPLAGAFALLYVIFGIYNLRAGSKGVWDNGTSLLLIAAMLALSGWAELNPGLFLFLNLPLLAHNIGTLGAAHIYGERLWLLPYDKFIHVFGVLVVGLLVARAMARRLPLRSLWGIAILAFSFTMLLGVCVESSEFIGYTFLPQSSGFFSPNAGETALIGLQYYTDTMTDTLSNAAGAAGAAAGFGSGSLVKVASASSSTLATETAFSSATRTTFVGSMMPASIRSTYRPVMASKP
jgi:hypothetical protein